MNRRLLTQLFIATLLTVTLVTAAGMVGSLAFFINLFVPLPIAVLTLLTGWYGLASVVFSTAVIAVFGEGPGWLIYGTQFGFPSFLLALLLRRGIAWDKALFATLAGTVVLALSLISVTAGGDIVGLVERFTAGEIDRAVALYQGADITKEQLAELTSLATAMKEFLAVTWPGLGIVLLAMLLLALLYLLAMLPATRQLLPGPSFILWKSPEVLVWPLIVAGFALFAAGTIRTIAMNLLLVLVPIYFLQGLAIVTFFFQQRGLPPLLRSIGYLMLVLLNPLPLIVAALGLFDLWADFRKPRPTNT